MQIRFGIENIHEIERKRKKKSFCRGRGRHIFRGSEEAKRFIHGNIAFLRAALPGHRMCKNRSERMGSNEVKFPRSENGDDDLQTVRDGET